MRYLSLFSGVGGGDIAAQHLLNWECVGYVEKDDYCQRVLKQRIKDGIFNNAPIFGDIRSFIDSGCAELYRGVADSIIGGPPCQPFSVAGKQLHADDSRNMFPSTLEAIRLVGPEYVCIENVTGFLSSGYMGWLLSQVAELRNYRFAKYVTLPAWITGSPHIGKRVWLMVSSNRTGLEGVHQAGNRKHLQSIEIPLPGQFWKTTPRVYRRGDGIPDRVERTKALGNSQCPALAATAWNLLTNE